MIKTFIPKIKEEALIKNRPFDGTHGIYVCRRPNKTSAARLVSITRGFDLCQMNVQDYLDLHVTIIYSETKVPDEVEPVNIPVECQMVGIDFWPGQDKDGYIVGILKSPALHKLHKLWISRGAKHSFPEYKPHISLKTPFKPPNDSWYDKLKKVHMYLAHYPVRLTLEDDIIQNAKEQ